MALHKNISDIIQIQHSCRNVIQELYENESRPNESIRDSYKGVKIDDALHFDIIEYDALNETLRLSADTLEYYKTRLGHNDATNIALIDEKLSKLQTQQHFYKIRVKSEESTQKELGSMHTLLSQIPSLLEHNLFAITSSSIFAFKSEPNFEIKINKLKICQDEISQLMEASQKIDNFLQIHYDFFKTMHSPKITSMIVNLKNNSVKLEKSFIKLFDDIKNFINQSIQDGKFIQKLQSLKVLKDENRLLHESNIQDLAQDKIPVSKSVSIKKIYSHDAILEHREALRNILELRKLKLSNTKQESALEYDVNEIIRVEKKLYNYQKLHQDFISQEKDLLSFLLGERIDKERILGVFIRMLKNYAHEYEIEEKMFLPFAKRKYTEVKKCL